MYRCKACDNTATFITEARVWHWIKVDGDGKFMQDYGPQGDPDAPTGVEEPIGHVECGECNSDNVEVE